MIPWTMSYHRLSIFDNMSSGVKRKPINIEHVYLQKGGKIFKIESKILKRLL